MTVNPLPTAAITGTLISCATTTLTAVTNASSPSYVWYQDFSILTGEISSTLAASANGAYKVMITDGITTCKQTSAASNVTIKQLPSAIISGSLTSCVTTSLSAVSDAASPSYIWYKDNVVIPAENSSNLGVTASGSYKFKVTDGTSACEQTSASAAVTIYPLPTASITGNLTACVTTTLTAVSNAASPSYIWYKDNIVISGQTSSSLVVTSSGDYKVKVKNGSTGCEQTSGVSTVTIFPLPNVTITGNLSACESTVLTAVTDAVLPEYVWYKDNIEIVGQTGSTLSITASGNYTVKVKNGATTCEQTSMPSTVTIYSLPTASITGTLNSCVTTTLSAVTDAASPSYIWYKNNVVISGETASSLVVNSSGDYKVKVVNGVTNCENISPPVTVTINPLPNKDLTVNGSGSVCTGTGTEISIDLSEIGIEYQLRNAAGNLNVGVPLTGSGGTILLPTGNLITNTSFNILATNPVTTCNVELTETEIITIDPLSVGGILTGPFDTITYGESTGDINLSGQTGSPVKWQKSINSGSWEDISNTLTVFSELPIMAGAWQYRAEVKSGQCPSAFSAMANIEVLPKLLTIKATNQTKVYGDTFSFTGDEFTSNGLINSDNISSVVFSSAGSAPTAAVSGSPFPIIPGGAIGSGLNNYNILYENGELTITKASLTVTADPQTKAYGSPNPPLTFSVSGFKNNEDESVISVLPTANTSLDETTNTGTYPGAITISGGVADNYNFIYVPGDFTISKADQIITFSALSAVTYGVSDFDLGATSSSGLPVSYSSSDPLLVNILLNLAHVMGAGNVTITASQAGNNNFNPAPEIMQNLLINKALLQAMADNQERNYGGSDPSFTLTYSGFIGADSKIDLDSEPNVFTSAGQYTVPGDYPIQVSGGIDNNYTFGYTEGILTINKADLSISADNLSRDYLAENPVLTLSILGLLGTDTEGDLDTLPDISTTAVQNSDAGDYVISLAGGNDNCYNYIFSDGVLTINKISQIVNLFDLPSKLQAGESITMTITVNSGLPVLFESMDPQIASVSGDQLTGVSKGNVQIKAYNDGNQNYIPLEAYDTIEITTTHKEILHLFTPNNDGFNDYWELPELETWGRCDVRIFNRWGKVVYSNPDYNNEWDGTDDGDPLPEGPYYFVIQSANAGQIKGTINLVR
ncbi:MAG: gliding motility-associated C-terminal domain-containing protein [Bacteroidales bacterium]|nr:gliding motility-associated C-terminal domain-containing protein [Bacteroidales bacterium]